MSDVLLERKNHTAVITIDKPETLNALCQDLIGQINRALDEAEADSQVYTIIITGSGKAFIAGADIGEMYEKDREAIRKWAVLGCDLNLRLETMALPVIAAINGYALGGGLELAMACDIRIASEKARMGLPETGLGVICGAGSLCFETLPSSVPPAAWTEIIYLAVCGTAVAMLLQNVGQKYVSSSSAAIILSLEALFGVLFSVIFGYENLSVKLVIGFALIFFAIITSETKWKFVRRRGGGSEN